MEPHKHTKATANDSNSDLVGLINQVNILATILESAEAGIYAADFYTGEILFVNPKFVQDPKVSADDLIGQKCWDIINYEGQGRCSFCPWKKLVDDNGTPLGPYTWEFYFPPLDMWVKSINRAIKWVDGRLVNMATFYDITGTKRAQEQLAELAFIDRRLSLKNALRLEKDIKEAPGEVSLIAFDILSLQKINEAYGRDIGDKLLISVRDWFWEQNIPNSELYRIGGDEFCLAVRDISMDALKDIADTLFRRFDELWSFGDMDDRLHIFSNASVAVIHSEFVQEKEPLLNLIERTLKVARNIRSVIVHSAEMDSDYKRRLRLELSLKKCVRENMRGFETYYQPIANPVSGIWCGLEALCRWDSPELGCVPPLLFIPEAERLELIGVIGLWILETSIRQCKAWKLDMHDGFILDVNVSAIQFLDKTLAEEIVTMLQKYDYPGEKLCLEITESTKFTFTDESLDTLNRLRANRVLVALDDFGTGYSSFNSLKSLPVEILKIERDFVTDIENDNYQQYLFRLMAELTHEVNMRVVAEGVENKKQMEILMKNGADLMQGYLFSKPIPADLMENLLDRFYKPDNLLLSI